MSEFTLLRDNLTGAYSRDSFKERLRDEVERAARYGEELSLAVIDLDHFKSINDAFGHARGDDVLREFAERARRVIRNSDILFRYGGDEFVLILPNTSKAEAVNLVTRLLDEIRADAIPGEPPVSLSLSIGVASLEEGTKTPEVLFENADQRVYEAKRRGRAQVATETRALTTEVKFGEISRLIEREEEQERLRVFFEQLSLRRRAVFAINGVRGTGRTALLREAIKMAELHGFRVISIFASPAIKRRPYGALATSLGLTGETPLGGTHDYASRLEHLMSEGETKGFVFAIDNVMDLDVASLEVVRQAFLKAGGLPAALVYTVTPESARRAVAETESLETIDLAPLSRAGVGICLRNLLRWEPPAAFGDWFFEQTVGLPGLIWKGLTYLMDRGVLCKDGDGWVFVRDYSDLLLGEKIGRPTEQVPNNLPVMLTNFIGREREVDALKKLLEDERLVTITGIGGIGKTRLALQAAVEVLEEYKDGGFFVPLAALTSANNIITAAAGAMGFTFSRKEEPRIQLLNYLHPKSILLIFDNFEHLLSGTTLIREILEQAPKARMLFTSRERLAISGEITFPVEGLDLPAADDAVYAESFSALQLFLESARRADSKFKLRDEDKPAAVRICRLLDGSPLGIELAAAWVRVLSCEEIAREIAINLDFLSSAAPDVPPRLRSLRAAFEYSWKLLSAEERRVFRKLGVFRGGFTRESARAVAGADLSVLSALVNKGLIRRSLGGRFDLHAILHQYAVEKLAALPHENDTTLDRHCAYFTDYLHKREQALQGNEDDLPALAELNVEFDNIRVALSRAIEKKKIKDHRKYDSFFSDLFTVEDLGDWFSEGDWRYLEEVHLQDPPPPPWWVWVIAGTLLLLILFIFLLFH